MIVIIKLRYLKAGHGACHKSEILADPEPSRSARATHQDHASKNKQKNESLFIILSLVRIVSV